MATVWDTLRNYQRDDIISESDTGISCRVGAYNAFSDYIPTIPIDITQERRGKFEKYPTTSFTHLHGDEFFTCYKAMQFNLDATDITSGKIGSNIYPSNYAENSFLNIYGGENFHGYVVLGVGGNIQYYVNAPEFFDDKSFVVSMWAKFEQNRKGIIDPLFSYGDAMSLYFDEDDNIIGEIFKGPDRVTVTANGDTLKDNKWHLYNLVFDTSKNKLSLIITNGQTEINIFEEQSYTTPSNNSLDDTRNVLRFGKRLNNTMEGFISNFHAYSFSGGVNYNFIDLLMCGIREPISDGIARVVVSEDSTSSLRNKFTIPNGGYTYAVVKLDAGDYDIDFYENYGMTHGSYRLWIDNVFEGLHSQLRTRYVKNVKRTINKTFVKGYHFIKIQSISGDWLDFSSIKFIKRSGGVEGGANSMLLTGNDFNIRHTNDLPFDTAILRNVPYNEITTQLGVPAVGDYIAGDFFVSKGLYNLDLVMRTGPEFGFIDVFIDDQLYISNLDTNTVSLSYRDTNRQIHLEQGKHRIQIKVRAPTNSMGYQLGFISMRLESIGGSIPTTPRVLWNSSDKFKRHDQYIVSDGEGRLGHSINLTNSNQTISVRRYFVGGLYKNTWVYHKDATKSVGNISVDGVPIVTVNQNSTEPEVNVKTLTNVLIPRGYRTITLNQVRDISGSDDLSLIFTTFDLIGSIPEYGEPDTLDELDLLMDIDLKQDTSSIVQFLGGVNKDKYDKLYLEVNGVNSVQSGLQLTVRFNGIASGYRYYGVETAQNGTSQGVTANETSLLLVPNTAVSGGNRHIRSDIELYFANSYSPGNTFLAGQVSSSTNQRHSFRGDFIIWDNDVNNLDLIHLVSTGSGQMKAGTSIVLYGRRKIK